MCVENKFDSCLLYGLVGWLDWKRPCNNLGVEAERLKKDHKSAYRQHGIF